MRRWIALMLALALIPMGGAIAASETVPPLEEIAPEEEDADGVVTEGELAVVDPATGEVTYPYWMEQTDGSEMMVFMLIDAMNDEAKLVEEHGSLTIKMEHVGPDGMVYATVNETLFDTEFGKAVLVYVEGQPERIYSFADRTAVLNGDDVTISGPQYPAEEFEAVWTNQYYPFAYGETLHAMAPDKDGFTYIRTSSEEDGLKNEFEYMLGEGMRLLMTRMFEPDANGEPTLTLVVSYTVGDPVELPDSVIEALREAV